MDDIVQLKYGLQGGAALQTEPEGSDSVPQNEGISTCWNL